MTPVVDHHVSKRQLLGKKYVTLKPRNVADSDTTPAKLLAEFVPGVPFVVEDVQVFVGTLVAGATLDVLIGTTSVLAAALADPTSDTRADPTLAAASARRGSATSAIKVTGLSDGTGTLADIQVIVTLVSPEAAY